MAFPDGLIKAETLVELARARAIHQPEQLAYVFLSSDGSEETRWTYAQLDLRARDIAATLRTTAEPGDRALILQPPGLEYVAAFLGCLYAGLIAVPAYPPRATRKLGRLQAIIDDARPSVALVNEAIAKNTARYFGDEAAQEGPHWLNTDAIGASDEEWVPPEITAGDIAFLQYTSGTTATPKGVMVSHANILHNSHVLHRRLDHTPDSCSVSWLPPYHDMGLIGGVLQPLYGGFPGILMAPATFARDPYQWLRAISAYRGTTSYAPNFAYDLCVEKITEQQRRTLDLGTWRVACNGAEPVRPSTLSSFTTAFEDCGFDPDSMAPGYGLAEATLVVSGGDRSTVAAAFSAQGLERGEVLVAGEPSDDARTLVSAGRSVDPGQQIRIVDPDTHVVCPEDRIGEIWVSADSVAQGYWQRPEQTEDTFRARLAGGSDPFMRTGDLGFWHDDRLYITGRSKDLIIVRGRNLYPQDLELCVERSHPSMRTNGSAAVALEADGEEQLLIVAEVARESHDPDIDAITTAVTRAIASEFDVSVHTLVLIRSGTLPKTSSGKIQRHACLRGHLEGDLHVLGQWSGSDRPRTGTADSADALPAVPGRAEQAVQDYLRAATARQIRIPAAKVVPDDRLLDIGLDSLATFNLLSQIAEELGASLPATVLMDNPSIAELAHTIVLQRGDALPIGPEGLLHAADSGTSSLPALVDAVDQRFEAFPVTDTQQAYLMGRTDAFEMGNVSTHAYIEFEGADLDLERFTLAWRRMIERHEMLRAVMDPARNEQRILPEVPPFAPTVVDLRHVAAADVEAGLLGVRERLSHEVRPADVWPLFEVVVSLLDGGRVRVHLSVDALISDFASGRILFRELSRFYEDPEAQLPPLEMSFRDYVLAETAIEGTELWERSRDYWWNRLDELPPAPDLPMVKDPAAVAYPKFVRHQTKLDAASWSRLKTRAARAGLTPTGLLLAAYAETLTRWSSGAHFTLNVPRVNRLPLHPQVNDVMGEFASFTLLEVDNRAREPFEVRARRLQEQLWNDLSHQYVSGVRVLRELMRHQGGMDRALMPVVLTSTLALSQDERTALEHILTPVHEISQTPQVWLDYQAEEREGELLFNWDAVDELFPDGMIAEMFTAHQALLQHLANDGAEWEAVDAQPVPERQQLLLDHGIGRQQDISDVLVQDLFLGQVPQRLDQPAVVTTGRTLTYGELHRAANQVAWWLREQGARPGRLVAIVMDKGWEQIAAAYGVLLSGAAYQPIDATTPAERLTTLLRQGEVELVLTQSHLDATLSWPEETTRLCVDEPLPGDGSTTPEAVQGPDDLAYTLFTSGSTGRPKGVMIAHRGLVNALEATIREFRIGNSDRALGLTALHHDMSLFDVFGILGAGGTLVLPDPDKTRDAAHWATLIDTHDITLWNSVPAMMDMLLEHGDTGTDPVTSLRTVFLGGDWIPLSVPRRLAVASPGAELVSVGGPTETTLWNIWHRVGELEPDWSSIPYGRPIANTRYYVLNERLEQCPAWVTGEMYVAGVGLAKGYWRDEERTAAAFLTHPLTGERLYRTGDLGRWRPEGVLEFMGRADFQVKIRGMRIEPGEIETQLASHPGINAAVVTPVSHPDHPGYHALTAYITTGAQQTARLAAARTGDFTDTRIRRVTLQDPLERAEFKLTQPGIRRDPERPRVPLLVPEKDDALVDRYLQRRSDRNFLDQPVGLQEFSDCLNCLFQIELDGLPKYRYPSGGGLYPVQTYVYVAPGGVADVPSGTYYYQPREGALVLLDEKATMDRGVHAAHNHTLFDTAAFSLFFVGETAAVEPMYGEIARDLCMIEAGYMGQLLMAWAAEHEVGLCPVGDMDFPRIGELFGLGDSHVFLHGMVGGRVDRAATRHLAVDTPAQESAVPQPAEIREWLRERLPEHMIPASVVHLDALPLTANGKVDRRNLPAPSLADATGSSRAAEARTPTESRLADIWTDLLELPRVGIHDNFFELGGQSLVATKLVARIRTVFQVEIALRDVFESRTVAELALIIDRHRVDQSEYDLLPAPLPALVDAVDERHEAFPVTDTQQAYLLGRTDVFELGNVSTHAYVEFEGTELDLERFTLAWRRMIERHEMLRAVMDPGHNRQRILPEVPPYEPTIVDLRGSDTAAAEAGVLGVRERLSHEVRPADVWPLFEVVVSLLDGGRVRVHLSVDALISDFASGRILFRELSRFYEDPEAQLPPLEMSFRDYVLAETAIEGTELWERSRDYWWNRLDELPPAPDLPMVKDPSTVAFPKFVRHQTRLDAPSWARLKTRAARAGLTPTGLLLAAYAEALTRWSRSAHFTLNVPRINRLPLHPQVNDVMGEFASFTLLEVDNRAREPFEVRARRLQEQLWNDLGHQYVSGVRVLRELMRRQGGMDRALMPVVLTSTLALSQDERTALEHILSPVHAISQTPQVWLDYQAEEREGELLFNWDAVDELFPDGMIADVFAAHHSLLQRLADSDALWSATDLDLLPPAEEERRVLTIGPEEPIHETLVQDLFLGQVRRRVDQPAVVTTGRTVTYGELHRAANQVAWWLREKGARPGRLVAIVMDKGWEQIAAAYGVLLSGAAYQPIDPGTPADRLDSLLRRGEVELVLTQSHLDTVFSWPAETTRLCVDEPLPGDGSTAPETVQGPDDLAYTLFTSGSTGRPKGVMIAHRGLVNALEATIREFDIRDTDRALGLTALHHDMSLFDVFGVLGAGGTLVLPDPDKTRDAAHWATLIDTHDITLWNSVPAMMEMLLEHTGTDPVTSLRTVFLGGDWIPLAVPPRLAAAAPDAELVSVGGPTETTLWNIWHRVRNISPDWTSIPYGRPIPNTTYYILNERLEPCPEWVTGDMHVAGIGVTPGYWNDPERTAAAFTTHPHTGERLYRTGDLGRWRPDGTIEFIGRADHQIKIRGMRIELGEIENQLTNHPHINTAVVTPNPHPDHPGYHSLTAYLTTSAETPPTAAELRDHLARWLPQHMLPGTFVPLDALPLTANGKVDRKALAALDTAPVRPAGESVAPRTPLEETLAATWAEVLQVDRVGVYDDFFALGGDSLLATKVIARLKDALGGEALSLRVLFSTPNVAAMADHIEAKRDAGLQRPTFGSVHGEDATEVRAADLTLDKFLDAQTLAGVKGLARPADMPRTVLLTGANGYIGRFLCLEWLERLAATGGKLICLVRGSSAAAARRRLDESFGSGDAELLRTYDRLAAAHLEVVAGDIAEPRLGLDEATWQRLADDVDVIVHGGALVNHVLPYQHLFEANVLGTAEVIQLALTHRIKPVTYVSSAVVATSRPGQPAVDEEADVRFALPVQAADGGYGVGYTTSKWAGEVLLREAHDLCGLPVTTFRSSMILAHSRYSGQLNVSDMFTRLLFSLIATGVAPRSFYPAAHRAAGPRPHYDGLPVDFAAEAIVTLSARITAGYRTFGLVNSHDDGISLDTFVDWLVDAGHPIERVDDYHRWLDRFEEAMRALPEDRQRYSAQPLLHVLRYPEAAMGAPAVPSDRFRTAVQAEEIGADKDIPHVAESLIRKYATDLKRLMDA